MKRLLIILCIAFSSSLAGFSPEANKEQKAKFIFEAEKYVFLKEINIKPFSPDMLLRAMIFENIVNAQTVYRQAVLETGYFTSDLFLTGNNLFGMKLARVRQTTASGEYKGHASYVNWYDSVRDYRMFQDWYASKGYDLNNYHTFLEAIGYATDKKYIEIITDLS